MATNSVQNSNDNLDTRNESLRRQSILSSSDPENDSLPIDCVLVYNCTDYVNDSDAENSNGSQSKKSTKPPSQRRRKFEENLHKKQGLIIKPAVNIT